MTKPYVCSNVFNEKLSNCFALIVVPLHLRGTFWKLRTLYVLPRKTVHTIAGYFVFVEFWETKCPSSCGLCFAHALHLCKPRSLQGLLLRTLDKLSFYLFQLVKYSKKYSRMNMFYWSTQRVILYAYGLFWISILIRDASTPSWGSLQGDTAVILHRSAPKPHSVGRSA